MQGLGKSLFTGGTNMLELLKKLTQANAPSGNEERLHQIITEEIKNYVDEITIDPLGNLIAHKSRAACDVCRAYG